VLAAYLVLCVVWGSTYLAIRVGVRGCPPALFAGVRFLIAGSLLVLAALILGLGLPRRAADWRTNGIVGVLLLLCGNGLVVWAEQFTPSGVAAIFVVTVALWMALFDAVLPGSRARPTLTQAGGLLLGFLGTLLLVGAEAGTLGQADWRGPIGLTVASMSWACGSVYSSRHPTRGNPYGSAALQMLAGGLALTLVGTLRGEWAGLRITAETAGALAYLVVFGSLVGYSSYVYVLRHLPPAIVGTHTYVNTVVAVLLGWLILDEPITRRTVVAMGVVLASVVWVRRAGRAVHRDGPARGQRSGSSISSNRIQPR
jgi:drug/metabolite transporter (DMT)-like permease